MKHLKNFESFKYKDITVEDIRNCIQNGGFIWATKIENLPGNKSQDSIKPISVDDSGLITVEIDNQTYEIKLSQVDKIS
jgi:hypothetical protein